jgi:YidC/Oxa1 family membrane protein insertase
VNAIKDLFHGLFGLVAKAIFAFHNVTGPIFGQDSGLAWALAIILLTIAVRALMYPLFVKQIKTQRAMQALQPKIKELQNRHKGDKETLNTEMMKLYKEHNANPFAGCLPMLLQMPIFIALFQVLHQLQPALKNGAYDFPRVGETGSKFGLSYADVAGFGRAKIFGAPIGAGFNSPSKLLSFLGGSPGATKIVAVILIIAMSAATFLTSKQMMGRNTAASADSQQATQQKVLLYMMPVFLGIFGFQVAIGVLIYWTTTNLFSMGQQAIVMKRLGPVGAPAPASARASAGKAAGKQDAVRKQDAVVKSPTPKPGAKPAAAAANGSAPASSTGQQRPKNSKNTKRGKGQRRGGRR